ncbi:MAG: S41 family peptidase [Bacteroidales bacterium]|nr:S41 family peptidase [Bacteroidales bacterium]
MDTGNKKQNLYLPILLSLVLTLGLLIGIKLPHPQQPSGVVIYPKGNKLDQILTYIVQNYVDSVNINTLENAAIPAILKRLDPHTVYIPASEVAQVNEPLQGNFDGIGISFNMPDDTIIVISVIHGGPSERIGIKPGDRIIKINDSLVAGQHIDQNNIVKMLKGPRGTKVNVSVLRRDVPELLQFEITRDKIPLKSVDIAYMINDSIGYIKISKFARTTTQETEQSLKNLEARGMTKLILDLRSNGGGYLDAAIHVADQFLLKGKLIVYTKGRNHQKQMVYAKNDGLFMTGNLVVLIDEWTASASEIVAGAIQDNDRGTIIGRRSFGKGLVQEPFILRDGSVLRLTVARYYTPTGRCIQKPYNKGIEEYYNDINERYIKGEFEYADSIHFPDSLKYTTPAGKTVYGGGGIMPDIFVPIDTSGVSRYFLKVRNKGLIYRFALQFTDQNREKLQSFKTARALESYLDQQNLLPLFLRYAKQKGIAPVSNDINISRNLLLTQIKAYIGRDILDDNGFYPIIRKIDTTLQRAIKYLETRS